MLDIISLQQIIPIGVDNLEGGLPANLFQAQRDYFGAHTCERLGQPCGQFFHTNWTGTGGRVASSTYTV